MDVHGAQVCTCVHKKQVRRKDQEYGKIFGAQRGLRYVRLGALAYERNEVGKCHVASPNAWEKAGGPGRGQHVTVWNSRDSTLRRRDGRVT